MTLRRKNPSAKRVPLRRRVVVVRWLELRFESELILPWGVVWIGLRDASEGSIAKLLVAGVVVCDEEVRRVGDVERLCTELQVHSFRDREVFEDGQVDMAEVGSKQRVALRVPDGSERLRSEGRRVEELRIGLVAQAGILDGVRPIISTAVLGDRTVVEAMCNAIAFDWIVYTGCRFGRSRRAFHSARR